MKEQILPKICQKLKKYVNIYTSVIMSGQIEIEEIHQDASCWYIWEGSHENGSCLERRFIVFENALSEKGVECVG